VSVVKKPKFSVVCKADCKPGDLVCFDPDLSEEDVKSAVAELNNYVKSSHNFCWFDPEVYSFVPGSASGIRFDGKGYPS